MLPPIFADSQITETTEEDENVLLVISDMYSFVFTSHLKALVKWEPRDGAEEQELFFQRVRSE